MIVPNHPMFRVLAIALSAFICLYAPAARGECTKDTDCKGERICTAGTCVAPAEAPQDDRMAEPASGPGAPAGPAASANPDAGTHPPATKPPVLPGHGVPLSCVCQTMAGYAATPMGYQAPAPSPAAGHLAGAHEPGGAVVRLSAGLGYWHTGFSHPQPSTTPAADASGLTAVAITLGAAVGGAVSRHVTVFGEVLGSRATDPSVKDSWGTRRTWRGTYGLVSLGPGMSYYFDQLNMYASGTLTITRLFGEEIDANLGWGANLGIGKEWRAGARWRTGVVAVAQYARADDEYRGTSVSVVSSLRFSLAWQ